LAGIFCCCDWASSAAEASLSSLRFKKERGAKASVLEGEIKDSIN